MRILIVFDTFSRLSPAIDPRFISRALDLWAYQRDVVLNLSRPRRPTDNAFIESLNGEFRAECLNTRRHHRSDLWCVNDNFMSLDDAKAKMEAWRRDYNEIPPQTARLAMRHRSS